MFREIEKEKRNSRLELIKYMIGVLASSCYSTVASKAISISKIEYRYVAVKTNGICGQLHA